jgi:hypothetical protein
VVAVGEAVVGVRVGEAVAGACVTGELVGEAVTGVAVGEAVIGIAVGEKVIGVCVTGELVGVALGVCVTGELVGAAVRGVCVTGALVGEVVTGDFVTGVLVGEAVTGVSVTGFLVGELVLATPTMAVAHIQNLRMIPNQRLCACTEVSETGPFEAISSHHSKIFVDPTQSGNKDREERNDKVLKTQGWRKRQDDTSLAMVSRKRQSWMTLQSTRSWHIFAHASKRRQN